jgi:hypothetical protein
MAGMLLTPMLLSKRDLFIKELGVEIKITTTYVNKDFTVLVE